jgi:hypothetical protein
MPTGLRRIFVVGGILLAVLLVVSIFAPYMSERVKFFTVNALSILVLVAIVVQAYIYRRQWETMDRQLTAFENQTAQNEWAFRANQRHANATQAQMEKQSTAMQGQLDAMERQAQLMSESLIISSSAIAVSERNAIAAELSAKAAERSVEVMRESYIATTRAYIGIRRIVIGALVVGQIPTVTVVWHNGGNTPASRFRAVVYLIFGDKPEWRGYLVDDDWSDSTASFVPPGVSNPVDYPQVEVGFKLVSQQMLETLNGGSKRLYAMVEAIYLDFTEQRRSFESSYIYKPETGTFTELYEYTAQRK